MMLQELATYGGNYTGFLHVSRTVAATAPFLRERPDLSASLITHDAGYDGQFMYLIAFDPLMTRFRTDAAEYRRVVDDPPYRFGRIGFSALTHEISWDRAERYPAVMTWITVLAHVPLALALALIAVRAGRSPAESLIYLAIPGFAVSTAFALPEALAAAGLAAGVACWQRHRIVPAALCFAAALLIRETGLLLIVPLIVAAALRSKRDAAALTLALVPVALWRLFVAYRFFGEFGWHAVFTSPGDFATPFAGLRALVRAGALHTQAAPEVLAAMVFPFLLCGAAGVAVSALLVRRGPLEVAAVGYAAIALSLNYDKIWSHLPSGERGTFELFLCLVILYLQRGQHPRWLNRAYIGLFIGLCAYTFAISPEASASRAALLLIR